MRSLEIRDNVIKWIKLFAINRLVGQKVVMSYPYFTGNFQFWGGLWVARPHSTNLWESPHWTTCVYKSGFTNGNLTCSLVPIGISASL